MCVSEGIFISFLSSLEHTRVRTDRYTYIRRHRRLRNIQTRQMKDKKDQMVSVSFHVNNFVHLKDQFLSQAAERRSKSFTFICIFFDASIYLTLRHLFIFCFRLIPPLEIRSPAFLLYLRVYHQIYRFTQLMDLLRVGGMCLEQQRTLWQWKQCDRGMLFMFK